MWMDMLLGYIPNDLVTVGEFLSRPNINYREGESIGFGLNIRMMNELRKTKLYTSKRAS